MDTTAPEEPRTTAIGLVTDAKEMLMAAEILNGSGVWEVERPTYYLLGHATEIILKAFLLAGGEELDQLKNLYGHDIAKSAKKVVEAKHNAISSIVDEYLPDIELLNFYYKAKELEYRVTGTKWSPQKERLIALLHAVIPLIEPVAYQAYPAR
ncbi:hypothetical protein [Bradyrhizobium sp. CB2312]|uniref:hypothetical protein n=1 Tax=Bradyrhizobium sp. CB2312 TaxID=3039155 RepID=UPI0024B1CA2D|nr:hypothetical protein [Bradyrhizobium sp. CB2312]WFU68637.1 hypothetical protein QA642_25255 [Bradyrhizobium sp. CB2312]